MQFKNNNNKTIRVRDGFTRNFLFSSASINAQVLHVIIFKNLVLLGITHLKAQSNQYSLTSFHIKSTPRQNFPAPGSSSSQLVLHLEVPTSYTLSPLSGLLVPEPFGCYHGV